MTDFEHKEKFVCGRKLIAGNSDVEPCYLADFQKEDEDRGVMTEFSKSVWEKLEIGKEYWVEFREVNSR